MRLENAWVAGYLDAEAAFRLGRYLPGVQKRLRYIYYYPENRRGKGRI